MLANGGYNALAEPVLHHLCRPVNQDGKCDLDATLRCRPATACRGGGRMVSPKPSENPRPLFGCGRGFGQSETLLCRRQHLLEARVGADRVEIGVRVNMAHPDGAVYFIEELPEHVDSGIIVPEFGDKGATDIVANVHIVGVEEERTADTFE